MYRAVIRKTTNLLAENAKEIRILGSASFFTRDNSNFRNDGSPRSNAAKYVALASLVGYVGYKIYDTKKYVYLKALEKEDTFSSAGEIKDNLPTYTSEDVAQHNSTETKIWVTFKNGVYDITDFVKEHPGGKQILMAAGSSVEPFWVLYSVHHNPQVLKILETLRVGNIKEDENSNIIKDMVDPYSTDPKRHPILKPASKKPFNAEAPASLLVEKFITPSELFYVRNHLPVPEIDLKDYELCVEVDGSDKCLTLTLDDLKKFPKHTINATIMCAGNRRSEMNKEKEVKGLSWGVAAIGNATWTGARLKDVLKKVGIDENNTKYKHIQFEGYDVDATGSSYGASIPLWKGVSKMGDVILAYEMNGQPISRDHGFPVRAVVPGTVGARNVKWLGRIIVSENESESHWQKSDYKGFNPSTDWEKMDYSKSPAIQELPVISAICQPLEDEEVKVIDGFITVRGYAWSGAGQKIVRVDLTTTNGEHWYEATIDNQDTSDSPQHWSWTLWSAKIPVPKNSKKMEIWVKAVDSAYNVQPESFKHIWNIRGVLCNAYHKIKINIKQ